MKAKAGPVLALEPVAENRIVSLVSDVAAKEVLAGLRAALDPDPDRAAKRYVLLRRKLVSFFEWGGSASPDAAAEQTLTAIAWKMTDGGAAQNIAAACLAHARTILNKQTQPQASEPPPPATPPPAALPPAASPLAPEDPVSLLAALESQLAIPLDAPFAAPADAAVPLLPPPAPAVAAPAAPEPQPLSDAELKNLLHAFETGLDSLPEDSRDLVLTYYAGDQPQAIEARHAMAKRLNLPVTQLRFHAHRTRSQLEQTVMGRTP